MRSAACSSPAAGWIPRSRRCSHRLRAAGVSAARVAVLRISPFGSLPVLECRQVTRTIRIVVLCRLLVADHRPLEAGWGDPGAVRGPPDGASREALADP